MVYEKLKQQLEKTGRLPWIAEEMAVLNDPATYRADPEQAWRRLKPRGASPRLLAILKEVAAWRERTAQRIDIPRQRLLRDEQLLEIASHAPKTIEELGSDARPRPRLRRGLAGPRAPGSRRAGAPACPSPSCRRATRPTEQLRAPGAVVDLLRTLLRLQGRGGRRRRRAWSPAPTNSIASPPANATLPALNGWRREVFGEDAVDLVEGRVALALTGEHAKLIPVPKRRARAEALAVRRAKPRRSPI